MANEHYKRLSDLRTAVRDRLDESTAAFWTDAQLNRYLNRAKDRVWSRVRALEEDYFDTSRTSQDGSLTILGETYAASSFKITSGTSDYTLPPDFAEMRAMEVITSGYEWVLFRFRDLAKDEFRAARMLTDNFSPSEFLVDIFGEPAQMRIAPKSDTALDLRITYVARIADLSADTDRLLLPDPLYLAVEEYATAMALKQDRSPDAAAYEASGDKIIAEAFGATRRQSQDVETATGYLEND